MFETNQQASTLTLPVSSKSYAKWLWLCTGLFALRVAAQALALVFPCNFLPTFESWHGGVLPYPALLSTQLLILFWMVRTAKRFSLNTLHPCRRLGIFVTIFASLYFIIMLLRLVLGLTIWSEQRWFSSYLPAFFHLVLASYLLLYGHYHLRQTIK